jgi:tetratricopeptide (TPR) repeat protein
MTYPQIRQAFENDQFDEALSLADSALLDSEEDGRVWELKGLIHHARSEFVPAVSALETASLFVVLNPAASVCLGQCYGRIGRNTLSRDLLTPLVEDPRMTSELLLQIATGLDASDDPRLAMKAARKAAERDPFLGQAYYDMGYYSARCGQSPRIVETLARKALSLEPDNLGFQLGLVSFLLKAGRDEEAYDIVSGLTNEQIERVHCRCCLERVVDLFENRGDYRRAILCRQQILQLELNNTDSDCL